MRKLITMIVLMLGVSIISFAQPISFEAGHGEVTYEEDWDEAEIFEIKGPKIILTSTDLDDYTGEMKITNKFEDVFIYVNEDVSSMVVEGHKRIDTMYDATDKDGIALYFLVQYYEDGYLFGETYRFRFRFCYKNVWYGYYCNPVGTIGNKQLDQTPSDNVPIRAPGNKIVS